MNMPSTPPPNSPRRGGYVRWIVLAVVLCGVGLAGVRYYLHHRITLHNWGVVDAGRLYRSGQLNDRTLREQVQRNQIGAIISLAADSSEGDAAQAECRVAKDLDVQRWNLPLNGDGIGDPGQYAKAIKIIFDANAQGKAVLVHCHSGAQRTGGVIAVYRVLVDHQSPKKTYKEMLRYGYDPKGNAALIDFLNQHMGEWAAQLVQMKVIPAVPDPLPRFAP